jgi:hypothetical protein
MSSSRPASAGAEARVRIVVALLCVVAAARVFLFAAAFPFFNNMDEQAHVDLVLKYARGHWPDQASEKYDVESAALFAGYGTLEFLNAPAAVAGGIPPPPWRDASAERAQDVAVRAQRWQRRDNHEAHSPPLYYVAASRWYRAGGLFGLTDGERLYWIRFLGVPLAALMVWCVYAFCRRAYPHAFAMQLGAPLLAAFLPFDAMYVVNSDALGPPLSALTLLAILDWYRRDRPHVAHGMAVGLLASCSMLLKYSNVAIVVLFVALCLCRAAGRMRASRDWRSAIGLAAGALGAVVPIGAWMMRNVVLFGDLTATRDKVRLLGWTPVSLGDAFRHPIFTPGGFWTFWSRLTQTLWRGEIRWHREPLATPESDAFYTLSASVLLAAAAVGGIAAAVRRSRESPAPPEHAARAMLWTVFASSVTVLVVISASFDYGACFYPSREFPYLASGRLIGMALVPFVVLYVEGAVQLAAPLARLAGPRIAGAAVVVFVAIACGITTVSEIGLTRDIFASAYNWFHLG